MTPFELQQSLERFTGHFIDGVTDALQDALHSKHTNVSRAGTSQLLLYSSSALDIATGPTPEVNILDMAVFLALSRTALASHWLPNVFGGEGRPLLDAFLSAERELQTLAGEVLDASQVHEVTELIREWVAANPGRVRVEWVRLRDFASLASDVEQTRAGRARGLLGSVKSAAQTADQAMLLAERALFLSHRVPFLWGLHARVCGSDTLADSLRILRDAVLRRWFVYLLLLLVSWIVLFWSGYFVGHEAVGP